MTKFLYDEFNVLTHDLNRLLMHFFICKGIKTEFVWDNKFYSAQNQENFTFEAGVVVRKFCFIDGTLVKPNIKFADIRPKEGIYNNLELLRYGSYYNRYPDLFPRFFYNIENLRDAGEKNGVGTKFLKIFGRFRLLVSNNGDFKVEAANTPLYSNEYDSELCICNVDKIKLALPEFDLLISIIKQHFTHPSMRIQKRNYLIKDELYMTVKKKKFADEAENFEV